MNARFAHPMKTLLYPFSAFIITASALHAVDDSPPRGWIAPLSKTYQRGVDETTLREGKSSAFIRSVAAVPEDFASMLQSFSAEDFKGKRVRFHGWMKAEAVINAATLWMRFDDAAGRAIALDNMMDRPLKGTSDWREMSIVMNVPQSADSIYIGMIMSGTGQAWMNGLRFEVVDDSVPTTKTITLQNRPRLPENLDLKK